MRKTGFNRVWHPSERFLVLAGIGICFLYLLSVTWLKWGDLIIDTFRDVSVGTKILHGKVLYKDFFYEYGLFTPYFLAALFKIFGIKLAVLIACGIALALSACVLLYRIARFFMERFLALLCVITFLFVCAFANYHYRTIFTFVLPYSFASVFFIVFLLGALNFFIAFASKGRQDLLAGWALGMFMAFMARIDASLAAWVCFFMVAVVMRARRDTPQKGRLLALTMSPLALSVLAYAVFLATTGSWAGFLGSYGSVVRTANKNIFFLYVAGFDKVGPNLLVMVRSFFVSLFLVSLLAAGSRWIGSSPRRKGKIRLAPLPGILLIFLTFVSAQTLLEAFQQYRCLPLILAAGITWCAVRIHRGEDVQRNFGLLSLFLVSLALVSKRILDLAPYGYGFYLLVPGIVCYYIFFFEIVKRFFVGHIKDFPEALFSLFLLCFFSMYVVSYWGISKRAFAGKTIERRSPRGALYTYDDEESDVLFRTIDYLKANTAGTETVVALPEGEGINFFAERENPMPYLTFIPGTFLCQGEDVVLSEFKKHAPDYVVVVHRPTYEYGYLYFGIHYAQRLYAWVLENYRLVKVTGAPPFTSERFGTAIYKRLGPS